MIVHPYSEASLFAVGGKCEVTAANFPSLKHFWTCKGGTIAAGGNLLDHIGLAHATISAGATASGNGLILPTGSFPVDVALTAPGTSSCLLIACGTWGVTTNGFVYGNGSATGGVSVGHASGGAITYDGTTSKACSGTQTGSAAFTRATSIRSVAGVLTESMMMETNATTLDVYTNVADLTAVTAITNIPAVAQQIVLTSASATLFGMAFFKFSGELPPKEFIQSAVAWLDFYWRSSSKIIMYPGFKGMA
mgnify:CR=1 FL=1